MLFTLLIVQFTVFLGFYCHMRKRKVGKLGSVIIGIWYALVGPFILITRFLLWILLPKGVSYVQDTVQK